MAVGSLPLALVPVQRPPTFIENGVINGVFMNNVVPFGGQSSGTVRTPPGNEEVERALLGALLLNNRSFDHVSDFLLPDHFTIGVNGRIYAAISKLIGKNQNVSAVTLKTYLENDDLVIAAGGIKYLAGLSSGMVTVINAADYGRLIYDLHLRRELICLGEDMVNLAFDCDIDDTASSIIEDASARLSQLTGEGGEHKSITLWEAVQDTMTRWEAHDNGTLAGISTGLVDLDREMGLLEDGDLIVVAGSPGAGKTALCMTIAYNAAKALKSAAADKPKRVLTFSAEMGSRELAARAMTTYTGLQNPRRRKEPLTSSQWGALTDFAGEIASLPLVIDDRGAPTLTYIRSRCRQEQRKGGVGLVIVDYLQIMGVENSRRNEGRTEEVGYLVRGLKTIARTIGCPIIVISSINRKVEDRDNKRPQMADLRSSGDIEFAADVVAFCYREEYYLEREEPSPDHKDYGAWEMKMQKAQNMAEVIIAKARHGTTGTAKLYFDRTRTLFSDRAIDSAPEGPPLSAYQDRFL